MYLGLNPSKLLIHNYVGKTSQNTYSKCKYKMMINDDSENKYRSYSWNG